MTVFTYLYTSVPRKARYAIGRSVFDGCYWSDDMNTNMRPLGKISGYSTNNKYFNNTKTYL